MESVADIAIERSGATADAIAKSASYLTGVPLVDHFA